MWVEKCRNLHTVPHRHAEYELIACQEGAADMMLEGSKYHLTVGQCIFCHSGLVHNIDADKDSIILVCKFDEKINTSFTNVTLEQPLFDDHFGITDRLCRIRRELREKPIFYEKKVEAMISEILVDLFRNRPFVPVQAAEAAMDRYEGLLNRIDSEYEFITFSEAARFMNFTDAYFSKFFKKRSGMTFSRYLNTVRIKKAMEILAAEPDAKIADIAMRCGFGTLRSFNREFRNITGRPPSSFRTVNDPNKAYIN